MFSSPSDLAMEFPSLALCDLRKKKKYIYHYHVPFYYREGTLPSPLSLFMSQGSKALMGFTN